MLISVNVKFQARQILSMISTYLLTCLPVCVRTSSHSCQQCSNTQRILELVIFSIEPLLQGYLGGGAKVKALVNQFLNRSQNQAAVVDAKGREVSPYSCAHYSSDCHYNNFQYALLLVAESGAMLICIPLCMKAVSSCGLHAELLWPCSKGQG